ncbi:MAG: GNAT family N-acetyltransferase [Puniceicoccales bacterium]|nr:GNAT family N-acetyltransferase [Puniceicoccales bacterium]
MNQKFVRRCWVGMGGVLLLIGLWGVGKRELYKVFHRCQRCTKAAPTVANGDKSSPTPYLSQPSAEVLKGLEERKKNPTNVKNREFSGLSVAPDLGTDRLILRAIEERDIDALAEIFADYETVFMLAFMPWPFGHDRVVDYVKNISWNMARGHSLYWAIALPGADRLIGVIGLTLEHSHDRAEIHFWLHKDHRGKGYMTEVARRVIDYVFRDLQMNRLDVNHLSINIASQRVIEKCGFKLECERDDFAKKEGKFEPMKFYRILRREYLKE